MADKVIKKLEQLKHCLTKPCDITCSYYNAEDMICPCSYDVSSDVLIDNAIQTIRELQEQIPKWHLVSEELPKEDRLVLCIEKDTKHYYLGWYEVFKDEDFSRWSDLQGFSMEVIAWMELPKFSEVE